MRKSKSSKSTEHYHPMVRTDTFNEDVQDIQREIDRLASTEHGAHVYRVPDQDRTWVISAKPLSPRQVKQSFYVAERESARSALKAGMMPGTVWQMFCVSAEKIGQIAKQEGIVLPRRWFSNAREAARKHRQWGSPRQNGCNSYIVERSKQEQ